MYTWRGLVIYRKIFAIAWLLFAIVGGLTVSYALYITLNNMGAITVMYDVATVAFLLFELATFFVYERVNKTIDRKQGRILRLHYNRLLGEDDDDVESEHHVVAGLSYQPHLEDDPESQV